MSSIFRAAGAGPSDAVAMFPAPLVRWQDLLA
jgi:hypothetical protein